ncbi:MAG: aldo/keto reductase, partial [Anaerolineae bacterium]|nr:aldo/keto reductase [Anaerolineae bacterium]
MQYRQFGKLDWKASALGFGAMRLPTTDPQDRSSIDEPLATRMVRYAIDHGVTYIDTAYPYHNGESERFVGRVLRDGYREKVHLATKLPMWAIEKEGDAERILNEQLEKLQTDHVDFYLFHGLRQPRWETVRQFHLLDWAETAMADGRIRALGFSFHDNVTVFKQIIDSYDGWTFCQIQHNYMDINTQAGTEGLRYAASKGLAVVIMEPLLGGRLADPPDPVQAIWDSAAEVQTPVERAMRWLWDQPEVSVVLSGMSTMAQVIENVANASRYAVGNMAAADQDLIADVRAKYQELCPIPCTKCEYCLPCTVDLKIPDLFDILNRGVMYNKLDEARRRYGRMAPEQKAAACIACHECEAKCPQSIPISEWMVHLDEILGQGMDVDACLAA